MLKVLDNILSESSTANKNKGREKHSTFFSIQDPKLIGPLDDFFSAFELCEESERPILLVDYNYNI